MQGNVSKTIDLGFPPVAFLFVVFSGIAACGATDTETIFSRGGLCVQLGGDDGRRTAELTDGGKFLVHRLDNDAGRVRRARRFLESAGLYGQATVEYWAFQNLPYADNLVNLIVADDLMGVPAAELMRVLCPGGVAYVKRRDQLEKICKPWPPDMDEWTHPWYGASGNMVTADTSLGVPSGIQWLAGPLFPLASRKRSTQSMVSAGGRLFLITQNELSGLPIAVSGSPAPVLVARDAFNGVRLWKRHWKGPVARSTSNVCMVAIGDQVFVVEDSSVVCLDAATGKTLRTYTASNPPHKLLVSEGLLVAVSSKQITVFDTDTAEQVWEFSLRNPYGTVISGARLFSLAGSRRKDGRWLHEVLCLDLRSGKQQWRKEAQSEHALRGGSALRIHFATDQILCLIDRRALKILSADNGRLLWSKTTEAEGRPGYDTRLVGHFFLNGLVWIRLNNADAPEHRSVEAQEAWRGLDPLSGEVKQEIKTSGNWPRPGNPRHENPAKMGCQPLIATPRFIMFGRQATCVDLATGVKHPFRIARGGCAVGMIIANGLAYAAPDSCNCFAGNMPGLLALASAIPPADDAPSRVESRLQKAPAYNSTLKISTSSSEDDWPTYRHDVRRSGSTPHQVSAELRLRWAAPIADCTPAISAEEWTLRVGNPISSPVIAGSKVFVAYPQAHRLVALDSDSGAPIWKFTAGGRIDTPPTIHEGVCLFGSRDGWVYCLRADDGQLVWRFRAAPMDRRIIAYGQVESVWPAAGTVLVQDGLAYAAAGRAVDADGGIHVCALDPKTGRVVWTDTVGKTYYGLCDILVGDGKRVYMSNWQFDAKTGRGGPVDKGAIHLRGGKTGLREAAWTRNPSGLRKNIQDWTLGQQVGQLLVYSPQQLFGYVWTQGRKEKTLPATLFAKGSESWSWKVPNSMQVEAMVLTRNVLFVAGPKDRTNRTAKGGQIWAVSTADGKRLGEVPLDAPPVFDGMAAAYGRLYVATEDGKLLCFQDDDGPAGK